jgi:hypothetical protein
MENLMGMAPNAQFLVEKWGQNIQAVNEAFGQEVSLDRQVVLASCLENTQVALKRAESLYETTQPSDVGPFKKFALELVTAVVPNLISSDIVSVQPMSNKIGEVRYIKYLYGSNKGATRAGTEFSTAFQRENSDFNYSSEVVEGEPIATGGETAYTINLEYYPVRPGTVNILVGGQTITDNGSGALSGTGLTSGTINYANGALALTFAVAAGDDLVADYEYNTENAPVQVPQIDVKIETLPILAKSRKLRALYAFDAAFDMQRDYGVDINNALVSQIAGEIRHEIDGEVLNDILNQAGATQSPISWTKAAPSGVSLKDHYESFYNTIVEHSNAIFAATKRASASFVVVGTGVANVLETINAFKPVGGMNPVGPHLAGYLNGTIPVYKNPYYGANDYVVGYKGAGLFDAGYVYAPYMPVMTTSLVMMDDFVGRRGFATSYGKKMVNARVYSRGVITNS